MRELNSREKEVCALVVQGLSNQEIGKKLFITEKTVKFHLTNIYEKLELKSRAQLIIKYLASENDNNDFAKLMHSLVTQNEGQ